MIGKNILFLIILISIFFPYDFQNPEQSALKTIGFKLQVVRFSSNFFHILFCSLSFSDFNFTQADIFLRVFLLK